MHHKGVRLPTAILNDESCYMFIFTGSFRNALMGLVERLMWETTWYDVEKGEQVELTEAQKRDIQWGVSQLMSGECVTEFLEIMSGIQSAIESVASDMSTISTSIGQQVDNQVACCTSSDVAAAVSEEVQPQPQDATDHTEDPPVGYDTWDTWGCAAGAALSDEYASRLNDLADLIENGVNNLTAVIDSLTGAHEVIPVDEAGLFDVLGFLLSVAAEVWNKLTKEFTEPTIRAWADSLENDEELKRAIRCAWAASASYDEAVAAVKAELSAEFGSIPGYLISITIPETLYTVLWNSVGVAASGSPVGVDLSRWSTNCIDCEPVLVEWTFDNDTEGWVNSGNLAWNSQDGGVAQLSASPGSNGIMDCQASTWENKGLDSTGTIQNGFVRFDVRLNGSTSSTENFVVSMVNNANVTLTDVYTVSLAGLTDQWSHVRVDIPFTVKLDHNQSFRIRVYDGLAATVFVDNIGVGGDYVP